MITAYHHQKTNLIHCEMPADIKQLTPVYKRSCRMSMTQTYQVKDYGYSLKVVLAIESCKLIK